MSLALVKTSAQYAAITDAAALTLAPPWSLGGWVRLTDNTGSGVRSFLVWQPASGYATNYLDWHVNEASAANANKTYFYANDVDGTNVDNTGSILAGSSTAWQHLLLIGTGTSIFQYVNGVYAGDDSATGFTSINGATVLGLGAGYNIAGTPSNYLNGKIAEWAKWDVALDETQRNLLAAATPPGDVGTPAWWFKMLDSDACETGELTLTRYGSAVYDADHPVSYGNRRRRLLLCGVAA